MFRLSINLPDLINFKGSVETVARLTLRYTLRLTIYTYLDTPPAYHQHG